LGPEGGRLGRPTQAVRHKCSGNGALCLSTPKHNGKSGTDKGEQSCNQSTDSTDSQHLLDRNTNICIFLWFHDMFTPPIKS